MCRCRGHLFVAAKDHIQYELSPPNQLYEQLPFLTPPGPLKCFSKYNFGLFPNEADRNKVLGKYRTLYILLIRQSGFEIRRHACLGKYIFIKNNWIGSGFFPIRLKPKTRT